MLKALYANFFPTVQGAAGMTILQVMPHGSTGADLSEVSNVVVALVTVIIQIVTLFKRKKKVAE